MEAGPPAPPPQTASPNGATGSDGKNTAVARRAASHVVDRKPRSNTPLQDIRGTLPEQPVAGPSRLTPAPVEQRDTKDDDDDDIFAGLHDDPNEISSALPPSRTFPTSESLLDYLQKFGQDHGWALACNRSSINRKTIHWVCTRFGAYRSTRGKEYDEARKRKPRTLKADCKFAINGFRVRAEKTEMVKRPEWAEPPQWSFTVVTGRHNHPPLSPMAITILRQRSLTPAVRQFINREIDLRTPYPTILTNLQNAHPEVLIRIKDIEGMACRRRAQQRTYSIAAATIDRLQTDNELYHQIMGPNNTLFGLVYLKQTSRALLHRFPTVLFFDPTYATDVHGVKLLHIVAFTSMNTTFSAGFVFMLQDAGLWHEDAIKAFFALAGEPKAADGSSGVRGYITDDDSPLVYALKRQFPGAKHLRCLSRMREDIRTNTRQCWLGLDNTKQASEDFRAAWTELIVHATSQAELEKGYVQLKERYAQERYQNAIQFVEGFKDIHEQFVRFHTDSASHFDQASNKSVEQQNLMVKKLLDTEPGDLFNVTVRLGSFLDQQWWDMLGKIDRQSAATSSGTSNHLLPIQTYVSSFALDEVHKQLRIAEGYASLAATDIPTCTGGYERRMGMPCAHNLLEVIRGKKAFKRKSMHYQWMLGSSAWMKGFLTKVDMQAAYVEGKTVLDGRFTSGVDNSSNSLDPIEPVKVKRGRPPKSLEQRASESAVRTAAKKEAKSTDGGKKRKRTKAVNSTSDSPENGDSPRPMYGVEYPTFDDSARNTSAQGLHDPSQIAEYSPTPLPMPPVSSSVTDHNRPAYPTWQRRPLAPSSQASYDTHPHLHHQPQTQTSSITDSAYYPHEPPPSETRHQTYTHTDQSGRAGEFGSNGYRDGWGREVYTGEDRLGGQGSGNVIEHAGGYSHQDWEPGGRFREARY